MNAKQQARELLQRFTMLDADVLVAKEYSIIVIDEIIKEYTKDEKWCFIRLNHFKQVKQEIQKI